MKYLILTTFLAGHSMLHAQDSRPNSFSASYFGETVTHPGIKPGINYQLKGWQKTKFKKGREKEKVLQKNIDLGPSIGFFGHKNYQKGFFVLPELSYTRKNSRGNYKSVGIGAGYMRTFIPDAYDLKSNGEIEKIGAGYNYFLTNYFIVFGKDLSVNKFIPIGVYIKPQFMYALPNTPKGVLYFALEIGMKYKLSNSRNK